MSYGEAWRLMEILIADPSSQLAAAVAGWAYPVTRAELTLRDLYDLQHRSKSRRKPKPYPRPWDPQPKQIGKGTSVSIAEYEAIKASVTVTRPPQPRDSRGRFVRDS